MSKSLPSAKMVSDFSQKIIMLQNSRLEYQNHNLVENYQQQLDYMKQIKNKIQQNNQKSITPLKRNSNEIRESNNRNIKFKIFRPQLQIQNSSRYQIISSQTYGKNVNLTLLYKIFFHKIQKNLQKHQQEFFTLINNSKTKLFEETPIDQQQQEEQYIGHKACQDFYQKYKNLPKLKEQEKFWNRNISIFTKLHLIFLQKQLIPKKLGIVKNNGQAQRISMRATSLGGKKGNEYLNALSQCLEHINNMNDKECDLTGCGIDPQGASQFLEKLEQITTPYSIILKNNNIGKMGISSLCKILRMPMNCITYLNLENNNLSDLIVKDFLKILSGNRKLQKVDLSKNFLSDSSGELIADIFFGNDTLSELYLKFNRITGKSGYIIFVALKDCKSIKVLDLSWNRLGSTHPLCAQNISEYLKFEIKSLQHFDISYNQFNFQECLIVQDGLNKNKKRIGIHFTGHYGFINKKCKLELTDQQQTNKSLFLICSIDRKINGLNPALSNQKIFDNSEHEIEQENIINDKSYKNQNYCHICENWKEIVFEFNMSNNKDKIGKLQPTQAFIHFDYESYEPEQMIFLPGPIFQKKKLVPPGRTYFFFTIDNKRTTSNDHQIISSGKGFQIQLQNLTQFIIFSLNVIQIQFDKKNCKKDQAKQTLSIKQISQLKRGGINLLTNIKKKWKFEDSIFMEFSQVSIKVIKKNCILKDFEQIDLEKLFPDKAQRKEIVQTLFKFYEELLETYRYLSAISGFKSHFLAAKSTIRKFIIQSNICSISQVQQQNDPNIEKDDNQQSDILKIAQFDVLYATLQISPSINDFLKNHQFPANYQNLGLFRYQFVELLIKLAISKYKSVTLPQKKIEKLMNDSVIPFSQKLTCKQWRQKRFFNKYCDEIIQSFKPLIDYFFKKYAYYTIPSYQRNSIKQKRIQVEDFKAFLQFQNLIQYGITEKDINIAFGLSARIPMDSVKSKNHFLLKPFDFIEAISRIAEKIAIMPYGLNSDSQSIWNFNNRLQLPLYFKLEALFQFLKANANSKRIDQMDLPGEPILTYLINQKMEQQISNMIQIDTEIVQIKNSKGQLLKIEKLSHTVNLSQLLHRLLDLNIDLNNSKSNSDEENSIQKQEQNSQEESQFSYQELSKDHISFNEEDQISSSEEDNFEQSQNSQNISSSDSIYKDKIKQEK